MSTISGPGGSVTMPSGFNSKIAAWNASMIIDTVDDSGFVDAGWHTHQPTAAMIQGSAMGTGVAASAFSPTACFGSTPTVQSWKGSWVLTAASGCTISFTGSVTTVPLGRVFNGKLDVMYTFVSDGPVTLAWA